MRASKTFENTRNVTGEMRTLTRNAAAAALSCSMLVSFVAPVNASESPDKTPQAISASTDSVNVTPEEEAAFVRVVSEDLRILSDRGVHRFENGRLVHLSFNEFLDQAAAGIENSSKTNSSTRTRSAAAWSWNSYGVCLASELGIAQAKEVILILKQDSIQAVIKSRQFQTAAKLLYKGIAKVSPKLAQFLAKKAAKAALPGGAVSLLLVPIVKCAGKQVWS